MSRRVLFVLMLVCAFAVLMPRAWAQRPPETDPPTGVITHDIKLSWDRSSLPGDTEIMAPRTLIAYDQVPAKGYGMLYLTCASRSDSATGRCETEDLAALQGNGTAIPLRFQEKRGGMTRDLLVNGALYRADVSQRCDLGFWRSLTYRLESSESGMCVAEKPGGTGLGLVLHATELSGLVAGTWLGTLELDLRMPPSRHLAKYVFNFDFTVTDYDAISIYFPAFDTVAPLVNMDLRYDPIKQMVGGRKQLEMCLYDGLGSQSEFLGVTVRDSGPRPPPGSDFAVWHRDGGSDDRQRLDYHVSLNYGGRDIRMRHGVEELLRGIDSAELRLVMLPGISQPVYCVPTPLTLLTPPTPVASKRPGLYEGELTVELRVPTAKP